MVAEVDFGCQRESCDWFMRMSFCSSFPHMKRAFRCRCRNTATFDEEQHCRVIISRTEMIDSELFTTSWVGVLTTMLPYVGDRTDGSTACLAYATSLE